MYPSNDGTEPNFPKFKLFSKLFWAFGRPGYIYFVNYSTTIWGVILLIESYKIEPFICHSLLF